jgi:signal transduction histidine kinase
LVNDLVDISRIQEGKLQLDVMPCDLADIVRQVAEEQRQASPERSIELTRAGVETLPVVVDPDRIAQVVTNYLTNAVKYSPAETPIAVRVAREAGVARVAVRDEGPGLAPEQCGRVWERGYRVADAASKGDVGAGLGLGLHSSRSIVEAHGGQVGVESVPGQGAAFWFTLPCGTMSAEES